MTHQQIIDIAKTMPRYDSIENGISGVLDIADDIAGGDLEFDSELEYNRFVANMAIALS